MCEPFFYKMESWSVQQWNHCYVCNRKKFYKKLSFEDKYEVWTSSLAGKRSMEVISKEFPSRVLEKQGRQEYEQYTQELAPYMEEMNAA